ncbi:MAG: agmatine deiminase family protein [Pseudobacteriovorax sp.]|nr:agmatine deiminase family protein [Pseudobacteriovorax sp.]
MTMPATSSNRALALQVQKYLNDRADEIAALGFDVVRVPMPSPIAGRLVVMRSYTNSLLANGTAIVPRYVKPALGLGTYQDLELIEAYEADVTLAYEAAGYRVVFVNSDQLIAAGGAVHCVTMQLP